MCLNSTNVCKGVLLSREVIAGVHGVAPHLLASIGNTGLMGMKNEPREMFDLQSKSK